MEVATDYEDLYRTTPDALGEPTQVFVDFFADRPEAPLRVLDVGCGQGRDALFIGRSGHRVLGVDHSPSGIRDLNAAARGEGLDVTGVVADITDFVPDGRFDVVLIDRTLHMLDDAGRLRVLRMLLDHVGDGGWCLIADERRNIPSFLRVVEDYGARWEPGLEHA